jgi:hypothetical protein
MPTRIDLTDALLALIPEDGSRMTNEQLRAALADEADEPFTEAEFEAAKDHVWPWVRPRRPAAPAAA